MTAKSVSIHEAVRDYYAKQASDSSCCSDSCCGSDQYSPDLIINLPQEVSGFSLGCGDPITLASLQPGETVLDLGSGGGLDCFLAARQVGESGQVIGVDMTPEMLERARAAASRLEIKNVEFRQGMLESLPVEDAVIDVVISNCVINLSPDKPQVLREVFRVLKPGGRMAVSDIVLSAALPDAVAQDSEAWSACISGAVLPEEFHSMLAAAGFSEIEVKPKGVFADAIPLVSNGLPYSALISARKPL